MQQTKEQNHVSAVHLLHGADRHRTHSGNGTDGTNLVKRKSGMGQRCRTISHAHAHPLHMPNSRPVFSKQLLYKWQFILAKDRPEAEAITEINICVINKILHRNSDNPNYKHYGIPIQYYVLKKESKDKYLGVCAVRYDEQNKDLVVWLIWKDPGVSKFGSQQIITTCLACLYDAILTIAEKPLHDVLLLSNYDNCYPYFLTAKFRDYGANYRLHTLRDTISNTDIHAVSYTRYPNARPKELHHYFEIPIWMKERKEIE